MVEGEEVKVLVVLVLGRPTVLLFVVLLVQNLLVDVPQIQSLGLAVIQMVHYV